MEESNKLDEELRPIADTVVTQGIRCDGFPERIWVGKGKEWEKTGMTYAYISFPTTTEYGGMYNSFKDIYPYHDVEDFRAKAHGLLERGWRLCNHLYTKEMLDYIRNAIISYSKEFPNERIFQVVLDEFNWN